MRACLEELATACSKYTTITKSTLIGQGSGKTKLDKERMKLCQRDVESIGNMSRNLRALVTRSSMKERYKTAQSYLQKLRFLIDDVGLEKILITFFLGIKFYLLISATTWTSRYTSLVNFKWKTSCLSSNLCKRCTFFNNRRGMWNSLWKSSNCIFKGKSMFFLKNIFKSKSLAGNQTFFLVTFFKV